MNIGSGTTSNRTGALIITFAVMDYYVLMKLLKVLLDCIKKRLFYPVLFCIQALLQYPVPNRVFSLYRKRKRKGREREEGRQGAPIKKRK